MDSFLPFSGVVPLWKHSRIRLRTSGLLVVATLSLGFSGMLQGAGLTAADLPELMNVRSVIETFVAGHTIQVVPDAVPPAWDSRQSCLPFPPATRILAYEENTNFIYACGEASEAIRMSRPGEKGLVGAKLIRRFLHLAPDIFVLDDFVQPSTKAASVQWVMSCRGNAALVPHPLRVANQDQELVCDTLWPKDAIFREMAQDSQASERTGPLFVDQAAGPNGARFLHILHLRRTRSPDSGGRALPRKARGLGLDVRPVVNKAGQVRLETSDGGRVCHLELPPPGAGAGWILIHDMDDNPVVWRRPLASGVLPHGPGSAQLLEDWESDYRSRRASQWDKCRPASKLKQLVEEGMLTPRCRIVDLGCGSGNDAIYLASKGFTVTAIDIAPTALSLAAQKAEDVRASVNWVLADVLALPELGPFDFVFDRGCYHNVRHVDAGAFVESLRRLSRPGTQCLILSLKGDGPTGVREQHMREDFSDLFEFERLEEGGIEDRADRVSDSWSLLMRRKTPLP